MQRNCSYHFGPILCAIVVLTLRSPNVNAQPYAEFPISGTFHCLAISPGSKFIAWDSIVQPGAKNVIRVVSLDKKNTEFLIDSEVTGYPTGPNILTFVDDKTLFTVYGLLKQGRTGSITHFIDIKTGIKKEHHHVFGSPLALSENAKYLITRPREQRKVVYFNDLVQNKAVELVGHDKWIVAGAVSDDGKYVATVCEEKILKVWMLPKGELAWKTVLESNIKRVEFTKEGKLLITGTVPPERFQFWNSDTGEEVHKKLDPNGSNGAVSRDGKMIVAPVSDPRIKEVSLRFYSIAKNELLGKIAIPKEDNKVQRQAYPPVRFSADGRFVATCVSTREGTQPSIRVYEVPNFGK